MADECIFCKIADGEIPSDTVFSDTEFHAFRDINPAAPTHILLIPRKHIACIADAGEEDGDMLGRMLLRANDIARHEEIVEPGFRLVLNCNEGAGQTVFHIHLHILGGRDFDWPPG